MSSEGTGTETPTAAVDTSVLVAALQARHRDHARCRDALHALLLEESIVVPEPALVETYSVLTRIPPPFRMSPALVVRLLQETLAERSQIVPIPSGKAWTSSSRLRIATLPAAPPTTIASFSVPWRAEHGAC